MVVLIIENCYTLKVYLSAEPSSPSEFKSRRSNYLRSTSATLEFPTQTLLLFYSETDIVDEINIDRAVYNSGQTLDVE